LNSHEITAFYGIQLCNLDLTMRMRYQRTSSGNSHFEVQKHGRTSENTLTRQNKWYIEDGGLYTGSGYGITQACIHESNEIRTAIGYLWYRGRTT